MYLDTEARIARHAGVQEQTWRLGVTCHDHRQKSYDVWRAPEWAVHDTPDDLWRWVDERAHTGERMVIVAHNLAYDLRIADVFRCLPALGWKLDRVRLDAEQAQCRWRHGARTIQMIDTMAWFPVALDTIGDEIGRPKPALPANSASRARWVERCTADVEILREAWRRVLWWLYADDLGNWQPTGASQAWATWRHRFMTQRVLVGDDEHVRDLERQAVWCGRSEAWRHGKHADGPYTEWDMQCAYLRVMRDCDVPVRQVGHVVEPSRRELARWFDTACVLAHVTVTTDEPVVPMAGPDGIVWPVGTFDTVVWDPELRLLLDADAKVHVTECCVYQRRPALADFARWLWPLATGDALNVDPVIRRVAKHWSRALIGRFGVRYHVWEPYGATPCNQVGLSTMHDSATGETFRLLSVGDTCMREGDTLEGENAVPSVMGWVMSETRRRLWLTMQRAGLDHVLHVDTDGLLVDAVGHDRLLAEGHAGLRVKASYDTVEVLAPRQVIYGGQLRAPGVPRRSRRVSADTWVGESWQWLSTALREGNADRVRVSKRRITLHSVDHRRAHLADGATAPFRMEATE